MAKKIKLNIKTFDLEGAFNPNKFDNLVNDYDATLPQINESFKDNDETLRVFRAVAGSPRLSEATRTHITNLNEAIGETSEYFGSVNNWTKSVQDAADKVLKVPLNPASVTIDKTVLENIESDFEDGNVGIKNFQDAQTYIDNMSDMVTKLGDGLTTITDGVKNADNSLPEAMHNALGTTIETQNDQIRDVYTTINRVLSEDIGGFKEQLQSAITDLASAARGNQQ